MTGAGQAIADWLHAALRARSDLTKTQVIEKSGVARQTFYDALNGLGDRLKQESLDAIAEPLGTKAPRLEVTPRPFGSPDAFPAPTPLSLLREAQVLLRQAERMMGQDDAILTSDARGAARTAAYGVKRAGKRVGEGPSSARRQQAP